MYAGKYTYYNKGFQYFILEYTDTGVSSRAVRDLKL